MSDGTSSLGKSIETSRPGPDGRVAARYGSELWLSGAAELDAVREVTTIKGQRWCLIWALPGKTRTVERAELPDGSRRARLRNGAPCGSARCPNCARRLRLAKSVRVEGLLRSLLTTPFVHTDEQRREWAAVGEDGEPVVRQLYMLTLTARHKRGQSLAETLTTVERAFRKLWSGRNGRRWRASGLRLVLKSLEVTYGDNGWHPHVHAIVSSQPVFGLPLEMCSAFAIAAEFDEMRKFWLREVGLTDAVKRGRVAAEVPFSVEQISAATVDDLSDYVSGLGSATSAALEATRTDLKRSHKGNVSVWELPRKLSETRHDRDARATVGKRELSHAQLARLWREWEQTMCGVHQLAFSPGWGEFMPSQAEVAERVEQLRKTAEAPTEWVVVYTPNDDECGLMARYGLAPVLSAAATDGAAGVAFILAQYALRAQRAREASVARPVARTVPGTADAAGATPTGGASAAAAVVGAATAQPARKDGS